jgi:hypothetical protein
MNIPFTVDQFFDIFGTYNSAIWPTQIVAYLVGVIVLVLALRENGLFSRIISAILALFWVWMGVAYHIVYFSRINPAAFIFGFLYVLQGVIFLGSGTFRGKLSFGFGYKPLPIIGACFILYAMVVYTLLGIRSGIRTRALCLASLVQRPSYSACCCERQNRPCYLYVPLLWSLLA